MINVKFSPDGQKALSGSTDHIVKLRDISNSYFFDLGYQGYYNLDLWDLTSGQKRTVATHTGRLYSLNFSQDGKLLLSGDGDGAVTLWDVSSWRRLRTFTGHSSEIYSVAFSRDMALSGGKDRTLKLWDLSSGRLLRTMTGHTQAVRSVEFFPDMRIALSTSGDRTTKLWDTATGELLASIVAFSNGEWATITPEGFFDASPNGAKLLSVVRGLDDYSIDQFYDQLHRPDLVREKLAGDLQGKVKEAAAKLDLTQGSGDRQGAEGDDRFSRAEHRGHQYSGDGGSQYD